MDNSYREKNLLFSESLLRGGTETYEARFWQQQFPEFKAALCAVRPLAEKLTQITHMPIKTGEIVVIRNAKDPSKVLTYSEI